LVKHQHHHHHMRVPLVHLFIFLGNKRIGTHIHTHNFVFCQFLRFYGRNRACSIRNHIHENKNATLLFTSNALCNGPIIFFVDIYLITPFFIFCLVCLFYVGYINLSHSTHTHIYTQNIYIKTGINLVRFLVVTNSSIKRQ